MSKKVKVLIEIDEEVYKSVENETYCGSLYSELRNGTPITEGDMISREALKKEVERNMDMQDLYLPVHFFDIIDNAPTVEQNWRFYYDHGYKQAERDLKRPQGEWEIITFPHSLNKYKCNQCQHYLYAGMDRNFCPNCGADMRGGAK